MAHAALLCGESVLVCEQRIQLLVQAVGPVGQPEKRDIRKPALPLVRDLESNICGSFACTCHQQIPLLLHLLP